MSTSDNNRRGVGGALAFRATWGVDGHVSEDTVHAWMDDELDAADALAVESHIDGCASCAMLHSDVEDVRAIVTKALMKFDVVRAQHTGATERPHNVRLHASQPSALEGTTTHASAHVTHGSKRSKTTLMKAATFAVLASGTALYAMSQRPHVRSLVPNQILPDVVAREQQTANVIVKMHADASRLNPLVVGDAQNPSVRAVQCLRTVRSATGESAPFFRNLRGIITAPSAYRLDVVGWPTRAKTTSAAFVLDSRGTLHGTAHAVGDAAILNITLVRKGKNWSGMVMEMRPNSPRRSEQVLLTSETLKSRCR